MPQQLKQWINDDTYYQILVVSPLNKDGELPKTPYIQTKIIVRTKKDFQSDNYQLYPTNGSPPNNTVGSNLPSPGVQLDSEFVNNIITQGGTSDEIIRDVNNFYDSSRSLLQLRKISQLIAQTWYSFLQAQKPLTRQEIENLLTIAEQEGKLQEIQELLQKLEHIKRQEIENLLKIAEQEGKLQEIQELLQKLEKNWIEYATTWDFFVNGQWYIIDSNILNGLISRQIFFIDQSSYPSSFDPENLDAYYPLYGLTTKVKEEGKEKEISRFLILPNSLAWQRITLSLLIAGQAYREIIKDGKTYYQRICEPILSTGEIVNSFALDVDWSAYVGKFKEVQLSPVRYSTSYQVSIPYPPIPSSTNLSPKDIARWATAPDKDGHFPFYGLGGQYTDIKYASPPFPYLPLSTT